MRHEGPELRCPSHRSRATDRSVAPSGIRMLVHLRRTAVPVLETDAVFTGTVSAIAIRKMPIEGIRIVVGSALRSNRYRAHR
jgi:hypothetical protein